MSWEPPFSTGTDRAEPTGLRRLLRLSSARRNLMVTAGIALAAVVMLWPRPDASPPAITSYPYDTPLEPASPSVAQVGDEADALLGTPAPGVVASPTEVVAAPASDSSGRASYTIYLYKLAGIAPDSRPGTRLDIWVTWKPPVTQRARVDLLLEDVELGRIEAGFEQGPVADLLVDEDDVPDLIYGERFGALTAVVRPSG